MLDSDIQKNHARPVNHRGSVGLKLDLSNEFTADGEGFEQSTEYQGINHIPKGPTHNPTHEVPVPNNEASKIARDYRQAINAIVQSRQEVEMLLADVPWTEEYTLSLLGPILVNLKEAESQLRHLRDNA